MIYWAWPAYMLHADVDNIMPTHIDHHAQERRLRGGPPGSNPALRKPGRSGKPSKEKRREKRFRFKRVMTEIEKQVAESQKLEGMTLKERRLYLKEKDEKKQAKMEARKSKVARVQLEPTPEEKEEEEAKKVENYLAKMEALKQGLTEVQEVRSTLSGPRAHPPAYLDDAQSELQTFERNFKIVVFIPASFAFAIFMLALISVKKFCKYQSCAQGLPEEPLLHT